MKIPPKGRSRIESLPRVDPADGAGGQASNSGDGGTRRGPRVPVGVVAVEESPPSRRQTFSRCAASSPASRRLSTVASRLKRDDGHRSRADSRPLTDEKWECIKPLMPPQKPPTGRPRRDHRQVLRGMLWIFGTGASWRDLPEEEFGPWRTVYGRYRQWQEQGLWRRIVKVLQLGDDATNF